MCFVRDFTLALTGLNLYQIVMIRRDMREEHARTRISVQEINARRDEEMKRLATKIK